MITLQPINETNFLEAASLRVQAEQQSFVQSAPLILARAYAYRSQRGVAWGIYEDRRMVGLAMLHDMDEQPACYHLCEFLVDQNEQGKGYGQAALRLLLAQCGRERKYPRVEVCVKKENAAAIHVYEKAGFRDSGYTDPDTPDCLNLVYDLPIEIRYRDIILRDMRESDIEPMIRWMTVETEWGDWDAPWESLDDFDPVEYRKNQQKALREPKEDPRWSFQIDTAEGVPIGKVSSYLIDENLAYISQSDLQPGQKGYHTLGISILSSAYWGKGLGTQALAAWIQYHLDNGICDLYLQTWSGNVRMVRCAEKLGFVECCCRVGVRHVRGGTYDALTFRLELHRFETYLTQNS